MPSILRLLTVVAIAAVLAACGRTKPDAGPGQCAVTPEPVVVERRVYVSIPPAPRLFLKVRSHSASTLPRSAGPSLSASMAVPTRCAPSRAPR